MRLSLSSIALLVAVSLANAQTSAQLGRIKAGSVSVHTGPGEQMPASGKLEQGSIVVVSHNEGNDWYAIQPPPGSLSWVNHLYVELKKPVGQLQFPTDAVVNTEGEIKIAAGMMGELKPLNVQRTKIPEGTILRIVGPKVQVKSDAAETYWYPIAPPRGDFRYIPKTSVELIGGEKAGFVVHASKPGEGSAAVQPQLDNGTGLVAIPGPERRPSPYTQTPDNSSTSSSVSEPTHALWVRARQAELDGNYDLAERIYKQLAEEQTMPNGDTRLVNLCYVRIQQIREWRTKKSLPEIAPEAKTPAVDAKPTAFFSEGILRATSVKISGKNGYALTSQRGEVWIYVVADGIELDRYIGRWVELRGNVSYPSNLSGVGLLSASKIESVK